MLELSACFCVLRLPEVNEGGLVYKEEEKEKEHNAMDKAL